jgi:Protein  of unknown function (DUF3018)
MISADVPTSNRFQAYHLGRMATRPKEELSFCLCRGGRMVTCNRMTLQSRRFTSKNKVRAHRERLRAQGLRPLQFWVPDVTSRSFRAQAHRQSLAVARSRHARADQEFVDAISADAE